MSENQGDDLRCERVRLLLSLALDGRATPAQDAEIAAHAPVCAGCSAADAADRAVRARCAQPATVPSGFADRVAAGAREQRLGARAQNRFLFAAAAAAILVAGVALATFGPPERSRTAPDTAAAIDASRETAGRALRTGLAVGRHPREQTPDSGVEDR